MKYDLIVIGSGPAGEGAAISATKQGLKVAIIEAMDKVGGNCTFNGTIPSKALRHIVSRSLEFKASPIFNSNHEVPQITVEQCLEHANRVIDKQVKLRTNTFNRNDVDVIHGRATFVDKNTIKVAGDDNSKGELYHADKFVIATGSSPYRPTDIDFDKENIYCSNSILKMKGRPRSMIIYGAGVIGSEYASIFRGLDIKVTLVNTRDQLLSFLDKEVSAALSYHFSSQGVVLKNNEFYKSIESDGKTVILKTDSGKELRADCLLFANGRSGNTNELNLDAVDIQADSRGLIKVSGEYLTSCENIYAIGDVIGYPSLASSSFDQGRVVGEILAGKNPDSLITELPTGIYTIPDISYVGKTEEELTEAKIGYEIGKAQFKHLSRAQIGDSEVGFLKILFCPKTLKILGIHCFGERSSEIIHIGQAIMQSADNNVSYFAKTTFNYPTMAEAYRIAALNGLNKLL